MTAPDWTERPTRPLGKAPAPELGRIADRWRVLRELAQGGMGVVYEGVDEKTGERCAIKVLKTGRTTPEQEERFRREADLGARLAGHPGIVATTAAGALPNGRLYCVMDFVDGTSLWELVEGNALQREQGVRLVAEVARAVAFAHAQEIVHRDLKPQNVMVTRDGRARLTDFGIAKALDDVHGLTATGQVMGTPRFMAPEQAEDSKRVDPRTDVFGLGAILYTVLTRRTPMELQGLSIRESLKRVLACNIVPPLQHDPSIDRSIDAICRRALDRDPQRRPPSAAALAGELEAWLGGDRTVREPAVDDDEDEDEGSGFTKWMVAALILVLLAGGIALGLFLGRS